MTDRPTTGPTPSSLSPAADPTTGDQDLLGSSILLVDDNEQNLELLHAYLEELPCDIRHARDGFEAVAAIQASPPDIVLLDVMMPGMSRPELLRVLRGDPATAALPVVFLTAKVQAEELEALRGLGALDVIAKPFDPMTLSDEVKAIWAKSGTTRMERRG